MTPSAQALVNLLAAKHDASKAFFLDECKLGEQGSRRLDAWVLLKTWSPLTAIGYEVKVNRSDFLNDRKWPDYLPVCHELYFVCPTKLIAPEELPEDVGLMWTAGERLVTKRKAVRRNPDHRALTLLMSYVLMSRARPVADMYEAASGGGVEKWKRWLEQKNESRVIGREVSSALAAKLFDAEKRARVAEHEAERLKAVEQRLDALGLPPGSTSWTIDAKVREHARPSEWGRVEDMARELLTLARREGTA